jgi:hypothetical protein
LVSQSGHTRVSLAAWKGSGNKGSESSPYDRLVTQLAVVLEAIHTSRRRFRTVRAAGVSRGRVWHMWWAGPKHIRTEEERDDGVHVIVQAGDRWWIREPNGKGHTNEGDPNVGVGFGPGPELLHPRPLLGSTVLEYLHEAEIAGRRAAILRARPYPRRGGVAWWGSRRPFQVAIDLESGVIPSCSWDRDDGGGLRRGSRGVDLHLTALG